MDIPDDHITKKTVLYPAPRMDEVTVRRDVAYQGRESTALTLDVYSPADPAPGERRPVVVLVLGYPDPGMERLFGLKFKDWGWSTSWARLIAASGLVAVTYTNREPVSDLRALLHHLRSQGDALGIDSSRMALIASSGHGPLALSTLMGDSSEAPLRCAILLYPYTMDLEGFTAQAEAATTFRFANPTAGRTIQELSRNTPLFVARAGQDAMPGLNATLDRFAAQCAARSLPLSLVEYADAPHAFDLERDTERSRQIVSDALAFAKRHLNGPSLS